MLFTNLLSHCLNELMKCKLISIQIDLKIRSRLTKLKVPGFLKTAATSGAAASRCGTVAAAVL